MEKVLDVCPASIVMDAGTITLGLSLARLIVVAVIWAFISSVSDREGPPKLLLLSILKEVICDVWLFDPSGVTTFGSSRLPALSTLQ